MSVRVLSELFPHSDFLLNLKLRRSFGVFAPLLGSVTQRKTFVWKQIDVKTRTIKVCKCVPWPWHRMISGDEFRPSSRSQCRLCRRDVVLHVVIQSLLNKLNVCRCWRILTMVCVQNHRVYGLFTSSDIKTKAERLKLKLLLFEIWFWFRPQVKNNGGGGDEG
jgi:hypothetical protein